MQKLYSIASLSLLWLVFTNISSGPKNAYAHLENSNDEVPAPFAEKSLFLLGCQDTVIVSLDGNCQFTLSPEVVAAGDIPVCLDDSDFQILVDDPDPTNQAIVDEDGVWKYYLGLQNEEACEAFEPCWGYIQAEDNTAPLITPPVNISLAISCVNLDTILDNSESLAFTGVAQVEDNCSFNSKPLEDFYDVLVEEDACNGIVIHRTFYASDKKGNYASEVQEIRLEKPELTDIFLAEPTFKFDYDCDQQDPYPVDEDGHLHPDVSGYPYFINEFGDTTFIDQGICGIAATYMDNWFEACAATQKIERTWIISDWCSGMTKNIEQLILVGDLTAPELTFEQASYTFSTGPFNCLGSVEIVRPDIYEKCSSTSTQVELFEVKTNRYTLEKDTNFIDAQSLSTTHFENVPIGEYFLVYTTLDACKNLAKDTIRAEILDRVKPVTRCIDKLTVSLSNYGFAKVTTGDVNEGSSDNCLLDSLHVRRPITQDENCLLIPEDSLSNWNAEVYFNCCDLNTEVSVELKAKDRAGNESICWTSVKIEDKSIPGCIAPLDVEIDCDSLPRGFDYSDREALSYYFGTATGVKSCLATTVIESPPALNLSQCGYGEVVRTFQIEDSEGKLSIEKCEQTIVIHPVHNYEIKFPKDHITVCALPDPDSLETNIIGCDLLAISSYDSKHTTAADECFKIFRKYRVINWCEYDGISDPVIIPRNVDCDSVPGNNDIWVLVRPDTVYLDANNNELDSFPINKYQLDSIPEERDTSYTCFGQMGHPNGYWTNSDSVPAFQSKGFWEYTQIIKVIDTIAPTIFVEDSIFVCINEENCIAETAVSFAIIDECVDGDVVIRTYVEGLKNEYEEYSEDPWNLVGRYPKYLMTGVVPEGSYRVEIEASDQCGNVTRVGYHLEVVDCKPPGLVCREGLIVELNALEPGTDIDGDGDFDGGVNTIHVDDLIASPSIDDCTGPVSYSINRTGETPNQLQKELMLICEDQPGVDVEVYAWDAANNPTRIQPDGTRGGPNYDYCTTTIYVQDNNGACDPPGRIGIAGVIKAATGESMSNVEVVLSGATSKIATTSNDGQFYIGGLREGHDYTVFPRKRDELLKGVSTLDIIYLTKHILGIEPLSLDLQMLAADINRSGSISTYDVILLRKAILNVDPDASLLAGWKFIDARTNLSNEGDPWAKAIYEAISLNNIDFPRGDLDFIGIKMGDVSSLRGLRSAEILPEELLMFEDAYIQEGEEAILPVFMPVGENWEGLQLGIQILDKLANNIHLRSSYLDESQYRLSEDGKQLQVLWDTYSSVSIPTDKPLFELVWEAGESGKLSEQVDLLRGRLNSEVYREGKAAPLRLSWQQEAKETTLSNIRVYPNPFESFIQLELGAIMGEDDADLQVELFDLHGRLVQAYKLPSNSGMVSTLRLSVATEITTGVYLLRVKRGTDQTHFKVVKGK